MGFSTESAHSLHCTVIFESSVVLVASKNCGRTGPPSNYGVQLTVDAPSIRASSPVDGCAPPAADA